MALRVSAQIVSVLFHPLLMLLYMLWILLALDPYEFTLQGNFEQISFFVYTIVICLVIPVLSMFIMKMLGLINSLEMKTQKERIGPLIVVGTLYLWLFINLKDQSGIPQVFSSFILGSVLAIFISFFFNNFFKLSLHMVGLGGVLVFLIILKYALSNDLIILRFFQTSFALINLDLLLMAAILITGLVASARLLLGAHDKSQLLAGIGIGALSQLIAYSIIF